MIYEVEHSSADRLELVTHHRARRGRGVLFATTPFVVYLLFAGALFAASVQDLGLWAEAKRAMSAGLGVAAVLAAVCFALGFRMRLRVSADRSRLVVEHTPAIGPSRAGTIAFSELRAFAIDPSLRSLGADAVLVAVRRDGRREAIAEGDPHSGQVRTFAERLGALSGLPVEAPRFTGPMAQDPSANGAHRKVG